MGLALAGRMQIKTLSDPDLIQSLKSAVAEERRQTTLVLDLLREVDRRRLYADYGYSSLWEFCVRELKYSEGAASRRIASMRLVRELPDLKQDILSGKQTLSNLMTAQRFFRVEKDYTPLSKERKLEILKTLENKTARDCQKELLKISSDPLQISKPEKTREIDEEHTELKLVVSNSLMSKLKRLREIRSHADPTLSYVELLNYLADEALKKFEKSTTPISPPTSAVGKSDTSVRIPLPTALRRSVWTRDQGQCQWSNPKTGQICGSRTYLEIDHVHPVALGGKNTLDNLRLLCRAHNQRRAVILFGPLPPVP